MRQRQKKGQKQALAPVLPFKRMKAVSDTFGSLEITCIGMPEIGPGRFIKLERIAENINGKYYITSVRHTMGDGEFLTTFRARRSSL